MQMAATEGGAYRREHELTVPKRTDTSRWYSRSSLGLAEPARHSLLVNVVYHCGEKTWITYEAYVGFMFR